MIDHVSIGVGKLERAMTFYDAVLKPLGIERQMRHEHSVGYGRLAGQPQFWLVVGGDTSDVTGKGRGFHLAFSADDRPAVDAFYRAALAAGATDDGAPGLRDYHPDYYAAFVVDPEGYRIEAVCHRPQ